MDCQLELKKNGGWVKWRDVRLQLVPRSVEENVVNVKIKNPGDFWERHL